MKVTFIKTGKRVKPKKNNNSIKTDNKTRNNLEKNTIDQKKDKKNKKHGIGEFFKVIFKKNQIVILTLALMLITSAYLNYNNNSNEENISIAELGDAKLVSSNVVEENQTNVANESANNINENVIDEQENIINTVTETDAEINGNPQLSEIETEIEIENKFKENNVIESNNNLQNTVASSDETQNYFAQTRLERETMYSQMLETYQKIVENENIPADQKAIATNEIKNINNRKNAISIIENLIKTKGFKDAVILINDNNIDVVVKQEKNLSEEQVAQITNIVSRELNAKIADIHISVNK